MIITFTDKEKVFHALNFDHYQSISCDNSTVNFCDKNGRFLFYEITKEEAEKIKKLFSKNT